MYGDSMQKTLHEAMRHRRTSLPATSFAFNKMQVATSCIQSHTASNISEARGIVVDMLANRDLPPNVISCLRAVATLLNQHTVSLDVMLRSVEI
uniref:Pentatricopeptide repeat-containing protein n=1 Tax=Angiostrongylus cantonensis TaxID=6313 RepID=A0A0K0DNW4_ANGCA